MFVLKKWLLQYAHTLPTFIYWLTANPEIKPLSFIPFMHLWTHTFIPLFTHSLLCVLVRPYPHVNGFLPFIRLIRFPGWSCWVLPSILCWTRLLMSFPKSTMSRRHTLLSRPHTHTLRSLFRFYQITLDSYVRAPRRSLPSLIGLRLSRINVEHIKRMHDFIIKWIPEVLVFYVFIPFFFVVSPRRWI